MTYAGLVEQYVRLCQKSGRFEQIAHLFGGNTTAAAAVVLACVCAVQAVDIKTVRVGNPGNAGELSGEGA